MPKNMASGVIKRSDRSCSAALREVRESAKNRTRLKVKISVVGGSKSRETPKIRKYTRKNSGLAKPPVEARIRRRAQVRTIVSKIISLFFGARKKREKK